MPAIRSTESGHDNRLLSAIEPREQGRPSGEQRRRQALRAGSALFRQASQDLRVSRTAVRDPWLARLRRYLLRLEIKARQNCAGELTSPVKLSRFVGAAAPDLDLLQVWPPGSIEAAALLEAPHHPRAHPPPARGGRAFPG